MRSLRFAEFGDPERVLKLEEVPTPEPGAGEVLVRLRARSVNPSDVLTVFGLYGVRPELPATPGFEGMGVIEKLGEGLENVPGLQVGQRVIPMGVSGTWQEYLVVSVMQILPVPDAVSDSSAAQFVVNPLTAWAMLTEELNVGPGQWLVQTAAGSTLCRMVIQIAKLRGFKTINVVRRRAQVEEIKALGGDEVVCTEDEDLVARIDAITEGKGAPYAIDAVGGETGSNVARSLGPNGTMLVYGALSFQPITIDIGQMIFHTTTVRGFWLSRWFRATPLEKQSAVITDLLNLMAEGKIVPPVDCEYDLKDYQEAIRRAQMPGLCGKILLVG